MLSCKNCGAQMSGVDLVCKNCGTPWGKKHKSRKGLYFSIFTIVIVGIISFIYYIPEAKSSILGLVNKTNSANEELPPIQENKLSELKEETPSTDADSDKSEEIPPASDPVEDLPPVVVTPPSPPSFTWISASSFLKDYPTSFTTDGKFETAWLEGVKGNGIGEWIMYSSETDQTVSSITIYNGYLKNDKVYLNNGRIKKLSLEFSDGEIITKDLEKLNYSGAKKGCVVTLDNPKVTTSVKLTILDAYQGAYYTDTGISEVKFN